MKCSRCNLETHESGKCNRSLVSPYFLGVLVSIVVVLTSAIWAVKEFQEPSVPSFRKVGIVFTLLVINCPLLILWGYLLYKWTKETESKKLLDVAIGEYRSGDYKDAIENCNKAIELNNKYAEAYYIRGNIKKDLNDKESAIKDYDKALWRTPNFAEAYGNRGTAKYNLGDYRGALEDIETAIKLNPALKDQLQPYINDAKSKIAK